MAKKKIAKKEKKAIRTGTVNCYLLNIREEPKPDARLVGLLKEGDTVVMDDSFEDKLWYKIEQGYVKKAFIDLFQI